jgi:hypothetical protein
MILFMNVTTANVCVYELLQLFFLLGSATTPKRSVINPLKPSGKYMHQLL